MLAKAYPTFNGYRLLLVALPTLLALAFLLPTTTKQPVIRVAFIGNSITFVNDLPRFVEALGGDRYIAQDSCLHGSLNLLTLAYKGNGMFNKWKKDAALIQSGDDDENDKIYDYGACSVPQLLLGHDEEFYYENSGKYNDGKNPCTENAQYLEYRESLYSESAPPSWDFVVMNDQSRYPATFKRRRKSLMALSQVYAPLLNQIKATAVLLVTYGYVAQIPSYADDDGAAWRNTPTETEDDMPYFTSALYYGYNEYRKVLERRGLPVRMAQAGLAFLTVWEEDIELWRRLFFFDGMHPSPLGTYLEGCVVYATIHGKLPPVAIGVEQVSQLWQRARRMHIPSYKNYLPEDSISDNIPMALPTREEAGYLSNVCRRVVLNGYVPKSLWDYDQLDESFYSQYSNFDDGIYVYYIDDDDNDDNDDNDDEDFDDDTWSWG